MSHTHLHSHPLSLSANLLQKKKNIIFYHCAFPFIPAAKSFPLYICTSEETLRAHTISSSDHCGRLKKEERNEEKEWKERERVCVAENQKMERQGERGNSELSEHDYTQLINRKVVFLSAIPDTISYQPSKRFTTKLSTN